jgi:hypothetical protein
MLISSLLFELYNKYISLRDNRALSNFRSEVVEEVESKILLSSLLNWKLNRSFKVILFVLLFFVFSNTFINSEVLIISEFESFNWFFLLNISLFGELLQLLSFIEGDNFKIFFEFIFMFIPWLLLEK